MTTNIFAEPPFAINYDHECDISECWHEETQEGDCKVTAFFDHCDGFAHLIGIKVVDYEVDVTTWHDRDGAIRLMTYETIQRIERCEEDAADDGYDPAAEHRLTFADVM